MAEATATAAARPVTAASATVTADAAALAAAAHAAASHPSAAAVEPGSRATGAAARLFAAGYRDLISVLPPTATLSPKSKMPPRNLGKAPGRRGGDGDWTGFGGWQKYETTLKDIELWEADGANIGLRAKNFPGLDIDSL